MKKPPFLAGKRVMVSQPYGAAETFVRTLEKHGAEVFPISSVRISKRLSDARTQKTLRQLTSFEWIVFTSAKAIPIFMELVREMHGVDFPLRRIKVAAVGPATAAAARKAGLSVRFIPKTHTAKTLAENLDGVRGKRILLPRASAATADLPRILKERGARVTDLAVYATEIDIKRDAALEKLVLSKKIDYLIFTSPSTVHGLVAKARSAAARKSMAVIPVMAIGPVTAAKAKRRGFKRVMVAATHTKAGIVRALRTAAFMKSS